MYFDQISFAEILPYPSLLSDFRRNSFWSDFHIRGIVIRSFEFWLIAVANGMAERSFGQITGLRAMCEEQPVSSHPHSPGNSFVWNFQEVTINDEKFCPFL